MASNPEFKFDSKKLLLLGLIVAIVGYGGYRVYLTIFWSEKDWIRTTLTEIQDGAAEKNASDITAKLTDDFSSNIGVDKDEVHRTLVALFFRDKQKIFIHYHQINIKLAPNEKSARVFVSLSRSRNRISTPKKNPDMELNLKMVKKEGEWKINYAEVKRGAP